MEEQNGGSGINNANDTTIKDNAKVAHTINEENKNSSNSSSRVGITLTNNGGIVGIIAIVAIVAITIPTSLFFIYINAPQNPSSDSTPSPTPTNTPIPSLEGLIKTFRGKLIDWEGGLNQAQKEAPSKYFKLKTDPNLETYLDSVINQINRLSESPSLNDIQKARAKFYVSYWSDFKTRVLYRSKNSKKCIRASSLYSEAIKLYLGFLENGGKIGKNDSQEHFFIIIELAHWLINRDAGGYTEEQHEKAEENDEAKGFEKGFDTGNTLLKLLEKNLSFYDDELKADFYLTRGLINAENDKHPNAIKDFKKAKDLFGKAEDVDKHKLAQLNYNLARAKFFHKKYDESINLYNQVINSESKKNNLNVVHRDLGSALILLGHEKGKIDGNNEQEKNYYGKAIENFNKITPNSLPKYKNVAVLGKAIATYLKDYKVDKERAYLNAIEELKPISKSDIGKDGKDFLDNWHKQKRKVIRGWNLMNFIEDFTFGSFVIHGLKEDDLLKIFHKSFYCDSGDIRKVYKGD